jgi:multicomponent Na+:H+ antiporter subunit F
MLSVGMALIMATMVLAFARALKGPTIFDRVLAVNSFGTSTVLFICVHGFLFGRPEFLDLALVYALMNFIGTLAVLKFLHHGDLGVGERDPEEVIR